MPKRNDGLPNESDRSFYSTRQRTIVVTFDSVKQAEAFDRMDILLIETAIHGALAEVGWNE